MQQTKIIRQMKREGNMNEKQQQATGKKHQSFQVLELLNANFDRSG
jgi:hypothetical protein